jgi:hypothetical protein
MPVNRKVFAEKIRIFELEKPDKTESYCDKTQCKVVIRKLKDIFVGNVERKMCWRPESCGGHDVETRNLRPPVERRPYEFSYFHSTPPGTDLSPHAVFRKRFFVNNDSAERPIAKKLPVTTYKRH